MITSIQKDHTNRTTEQSAAYIAEIIEAERPFHFL